jgi:hypothetical protein
MATRSTGGGDVMGGFYGSVQIRSQDRDSVRAALE